MKGAESDREDIRKKMEKTEKKSLTFEIHSFV